MAARFFLRIVLVIALARVGGRIGLSILNDSRLLDSRLLDSGDSLFLRLDAIAGRLLAAFFFAVLRRSVIQVGPGDPSPSRSRLTIVTAVPIEGMIGREKTIAPLEQAHSGRTATGFVLRFSSR